MKKPRQIFLNTFRRHRFAMLTGLCLGGIGVVLIQASHQETTGTSILDALSNLLTIRNIGYALTYVGAGIVYFLLLRGMRSKSFSDIDEKRRTVDRAWSDVENKTLITELRSLKSSATIDYSKIEELIKRSQPSAPMHVSVAKSFEEYFGAIVHGLSTRAAIADEKSSVLLDKGIFHVRFGMLFYFGAIVVWQILVHYNGYKTEYFYGMATTSLLFLFIEFLSAWFLKQYRHFVDTATYLLKVKAIFDRYYLIYMALKGNEKHISADVKKLKTLSDALTDDIKWPSDTHLTRADALFAREALDSVSDLLKALKPNRKEKKEMSSADE